MSAVGRLGVVKFVGAMAVWFVALHLALSGGLTLPFMIMLWLGVPLVSAIILWPIRIRVIAVACVPLVLVAWFSTGAWWTGTADTPPGAHVGGIRLTGAVFTVMLQFAAFLVGYGAMAARQQLRDGHL